MTLLGVSATFMWTASCWDLQWPLQHITSLIGKYLLQSTFLIHCEVYDLNHSFTLSWCHRGPYRYPCFEDHSCILSTLSSLYCPCLIKAWKLPKDNLWNSLFYKGVLGQHHHHVTATHVRTAACAMIVGLTIFVSAKAFSLEATALKVKIASNVQSWFLFNFHLNLYY